MKAERLQLVLPMLAEHVDVLNAPAAAIQQAARLLAQSTTRGDEALASACAEIAGEPLDTLRKSLNRHRKLRRAAAWGVLGRSYFVMPRSVADAFRPMPREQAMAVAARIERETGEAPQILVAVAGVAV